MGQLHLFFDVEGKTLLGRGYLKRNMHCIISQSDYADQYNWATKLRVRSEASFIGLFILVNESDHNFLI